MELGQGRELGLVQGSDRVQELVPAVELDQGLALEADLERVQEKDQEVDREVGPVLEKVQDQGLGLDRVLVRVAALDLD